jgi:hypothetical protein
MPKGQFKDPIARAKKIFDFHLSASHYLSFLPRLFGLRLARRMVAGGVLFAVVIA